VEQAEIGVDGVDVDTQHSGDVYGCVARRVKQNGFHASALPRLQRLLQQAMKPVEFLCRGRTNRQGAGHGLSSSSAPLFHSTNPLVTNSYNSSVTRRLRERPRMWLRITAFGRCRRVHRGKDAGECAEVRTDVKEGREGGFDFA
jgi:hypothetical protein